MERPEPVPVPAPAAATETDAEADEDDADETDGSTVIRLGDGAGGAPLQLDTLHVWPFGISRNRLEQAVRDNVRVTADHLRHGSDVLESLIKNDGLLVVGAEYSLDTGVVDFFDGLPNSQ